MLKGKSQTILFKQVYDLVRRSCQRIKIDRYQTLWFSFLLALTAMVFLFAEPVLSVGTGFALVLFMFVLGWMGRQWPAMQLSLVGIVLLSAMVFVTETSNLFVSFMMPAASMMLLACLLLAMVLDSGKTRLTERHVCSLAWAVIVSYVLLVIFRGVTRYTESVSYASLPLTSLDDVLLLSVVVIVFLYLLFQHTHKRIQGSFVAFIPATVIGFYLTLRVGEVGRQQALPDMVLEHDLLLIHVPAMVIAFALMINGASFALLRLITDTAWFRTQQKFEVLKIMPTRLDDYLYRSLALAITFMGLGLMTGMIWSSQTWGHYWYSEAKQSLSLAVWLYYLAGMHLRLQKGMPMRPFAWWCLAGLPLLLLSFFGTNLWPPGLHSFGEV